MNEARFRVGNAFTNIGVIRPYARGKPLVERKKMLFKPKLKTSNIRMRPFTFTELLPRTEKILGRNYIIKSYTMNPPPRKNAYRNSQNPAVA